MCISQFGTYLGLYFKSYYGNKNFSKILLENSISGHFLAVMQSSSSPVAHRATMPRSTLPQVRWAPCGAAGGGTASLSIYPYMGLKRFSISLVFKQVIQTQCHWALTIQLNIQATSRHTLSAMGYLGYGLGWKLNLENTTHTLLKMSWFPLHKHF